MVPGSGSKAGDSPILPLSVRPSLFPSSFPSRPPRPSRFAALPLFAALLAMLSAGLACAQQAGRTPSRVELSASTIEGSARTQATFTARVAGLDSSSVPTGSVSFMSGERSIGAAFLDGEARATYTATALPAGEQSVTAVYEGDSSYEAAKSAPAAVNSTTSGVPGFTLSTSASSLSVAAGGTATTVITATPENGFNQAVSLSCSGIPYASVTCVFSPAQVTPGPQTASAPNGTAAVSTLSIVTSAPSGAMLRQDPRSGGEIAYGLAVPGILALVGLGLARKRSGFGKAAGGVRMAALLCLLLAGGMGLSSCSQRYSYFHRPPQGNPGTPTGPYTVVVSGITGTGSSLSTATVQLTLTVTGS